MAYPNPKHKPNPNPNPDPNPKPKPNPRHSPHPNPNQAPLEIFLRELRLHPLSLTIDLQMEPMCADPELQEFHPMKQLVGLAQQLVSQARLPPRHDLALTSPDLAPISP